MTVTIHATRSHDLLQLIRDLQLLDGGPGHRIRRAVHGSGAIVEDDLALAWLTLVGNPSPEFLESLMRAAPELEDLVGRRVSDAALRELWLYRTATEELQPEAEELQPGGTVAAPIRQPPVKASSAAWKEWAVKARLLTAAQAEASTKAEIRKLAETSAPEETKEG